MPITLRTIAQSTLQGPTGPAGATGTAGVTGPTGPSVTGPTGPGGVVPKVSSVSITDNSYTVLDDTAVDTSGGYIKVTGSGFTAGCSVLVGTTPATSTTFISESEVRAQVPAQSAGTYIVYVVNSDGGTATRVNGITYSATPTWTTASALPNATTNVAYSYQLSANGATTYSLQSGSTLPSGATLSSGGLLSGNTSVGSDTTYSFTVLATDAELQDSPRTFSLSVNNIQLVPVEYLVLAGGGGGGLYFGGGGGAGGYRTANNFNVTVGTTYTITVGAGGSGWVGGGVVATSGSLSTFSTITSAGGGHGAHSDPDTNAANGGSGGGGNGYNNTTGGLGNTPSTSPSQGNNGANGVYNSRGGGGGGAGSAGNADNGGAGVYSSISGTTDSYAGGGAAHSGVADAVGGGGGPGVNGSASRGGGGGGYTGTVSRAGNGGSGVVIIRYPDTYSAAASTTGSPTLTVAGGYRVYKFTGSGSITF